MEKLLVTLLPLAYALLLFFAFLVLVFKFKDGSVSIRGLGIEIVLKRNSKKKADGLDQ